MSDDTSDLLEQLRTRHVKLGFNEVTESLFSAAADEIERLRAENDRLRGAIIQCEIFVKQFQRENEERGKNAVSNNARLKYRAVAARSGVILCSVKKIARAALGEERGCPTSTIK